MAETIKKYTGTIILYGLAGLFLRIIFIPLAMHSDMFYIHMFASKLAYYGIFDIYGYINIHFADTLVRLGTSYYPPLTYFIIGIFDMIFKPFVPGFGVWMDRVTQMAILSDYSNYIQLFDLPFNQLGAYLASMKVPYLLFEAGCIFFMLKYVALPEKAARAFKLWMLNPVFIFGSYIFGQFDVLICAFLLLALFLMSKKQIYMAMFVLGCSALLKSSLLILILPLGLLLGTNIRQSVKLIAVALLPIIAATIPFYISNGSYFFRAFFPKALHAAGANRIDTIEFLIGKIIFLVSYILIIFKLLFKKDKSQDPGFDGWRYILGLTLLSYFIIYTPVHYFEWAVPFLIIGVVDKKIPFSIYALQILLLFIYAINSRPLSAQLFMPVNPQFFYNLKGLPELMNQFVNWGIVMRAARFLFYCCSAYIIWKMLFKTEVKSA